MAAWPARAEAGEVRGWNFGHYGRLVFDTGAPIDYRVENAGESLTLAFDAPIDTDMAASLADAAARLSGFVSQAEIDDDGRRVVLTPTAVLRVNDFATESGVAIDIWFADPPTSPEGGDADSQGEPPQRAAAGSGARLSLAPPARVAERPATAAMAEQPATAAGATPAPASQPSDRPSAPQNPTTAAPGQIAAPSGRNGAAGQAAEPGRIRPETDAAPPQREAGPNEPEAAGDEPEVAANEAGDEPEAAAEEAAAPAPAETGDAAAPRPVIRVRAGQHPTYTRLVFDRPEPSFPYVVRRDGATIRVAFDAPAEADLRRVRPGNLRSLADIAAAPARDALTVSLDIDPEVTVRYMALDYRLVVDLIPARHQAQRFPGSELLPPAPPTLETEERVEAAETADPAEAEIEAEAAAAAQPSEDRPQPTAGEPEAGDAVEDPAGESAAADAAVPQPATAPGGSGAVPDVRAHFALPTSRPAPPRANPETARAAPPASPPSEAARPGPVAAPERVGDSAPRGAETPMPAETANPAGTAADPGGRLDRSAGMVPEWVAGAEAEAEERTADRRSTRAARPETGSGSAVFAPEIPTALAVFERAGNLWIVFAAAGPFDVNTLLAAGAAGFGPGAVIPADGGFAFRFAMPPDRHPMAIRDANEWRVSLTEEPTPPAQPLRVERTTEDGFSPRLFIATAAAHGVVTIRDPLVGDTLIVVPIRQGASGLSQPRQFPQLRLLPAAQGVVVEPLSDAVDVQIAETGIDIRAGESLWVSDLPDRDRTLLATGTAGDQLFDVASWASPSGTFNQRRQELVRRVALSSEDSRHAARLDLARFFVAHGFGAEAIGELTLIAEENPEIARRLDFVALRGAARILAGQPEAGAQDLQRGWLAESREAGLWRAVAAADRGAWPQAAEELERAGDQLYAYPQPLRDQLLLRAAATWVEIGARRQATEALGRLAETGAGRREFGPALAYLRGRLALQRADARAATIELTRAADSDDRLYHRLGEMALIRHQRQQGELPLEDEIARLEALRFAWRGDRLEFEALTELAGAYWRGNRFREALETWQDVTGLFPENPEAQVIEDVLSDRLISLFDGPDADEITPLSAVALFRDYEHLIPTQAERDRLTAILAERLVEMDLLADAGDLLQGLVEERLSGAEKARMGARLAGIRLLDDRPEAAIAALDDSAVPGLDDPDLREERRLLRARALSDLDDPEAALVLLEPAQSAIADAARLDIAWRANDWQTAAWLLAERREPPPAEGAAIAAEQAEIVVNSAIALALSGDRDGLDALVEDYGPAMRGSPQASTFALVTRPSIGIGPLADLASIREQMAEVDLFQRFLTRYRDGSIAGATN